jgi:hypothetical protein
VLLGEVGRSRHDVAEPSGRRADGSPPAAPPTVTWAGPGPRRSPARSRSRRWPHGPARRS